MSEYKHGDWYCVPANEEEAREIIERAVASGADNRDSDWEYNGGGCAASLLAIEAIYDALQSGELKAPGADK